ARLEGPVGPRPAHDRVPHAEKEEAAERRDAGAATGAELAAQLRLAVAVGVAEDQHTALLPFERDGEVAVGERHHVARPADAVGDDERAESGWQREAGVVGIAG